jgi:hypothetical protein
MSDSVDKQLNQYQNLIENLRAETLQEFNRLNDPVASIRGASISISKFIDENFELVNGNENMTEVNTVLITALAQIKNYLLSEPSRVITDLNNAKSKYEAYDRCLKVLEESRIISEPAAEDSTIELEQDTLESEVQVGSENDVIIEKDPEDKPEHEQLWNKPSEENRPRRVGERPESLRKIRQEMFKNQGEESQPEDI